jgi:hypothetical protein
MNSLGGKNSLGRQSGTRSSRVSSTIFYQLRKLDRQISDVQQQIRAHWLFGSCKKLKERLKHLDAKRKELRAKRKAQTLGRRIGNAAKRL